MSDTTILTDFDCYLMGEGSHERTYEKMGHTWLRFTAEK